MADNERDEGPDGHYQPWLRNQAGAAQDGVNRPAPLPTTDGAAPRAREMSADELLARPIFIPQPTPPGPGMGARMGAAFDGMMQWLARANAKADIPARIARLELGRRFSTAASVSGEALGKAASVSGEALGKAASASGEALGKAASASREALGKAAAASGEALGKAASASGEALSSGAAKTSEATKSALSAASRAAERVGDATGPRIKSAAAGARDSLNSGAAKAAELTRKVGEAAPGAIIGPKAGEAPGSALDRLLAEEEALEAEREAARAAQPDAAPMVPGLPLFAETSGSTPPNRPAEVTGVTGVGAPSAVVPQAANPTAPPAGDSAVAKPATAIPDVKMPDIKMPKLDLSALSPAQWRMPDGMAQWARYPATWVLGGVALLGIGFSGGMLWNGGDGASVRAYLLEHPEVLPEAMDRLQAREAAANVNRLRAEIERPFSGAWAGAADGDVTLTVFTDYACTFCRASVPDIERLLREDHKLKIVFREMPILSPDSEVAARLALVAAKHGHYMPVHRALFASANPNAAARSAAATRFDVPNDSAALNNAAITRELQDNIALARQLNFDGTPSWVVGDEVMNGAQGYDKLREAIARARADS